MPKITVKKSAIGSATFVNGIGWIKIKESHAPMLARHGMDQFLDFVPFSKKLEPAKNKNKKNDKKENDDAPAQS